jgi:hypothetical protein
MMIGTWYCDYSRIRMAVVYWTHGPRKCNECLWMVPDPRHPDWQ